MGQKGPFFPPGRAKRAKTDRFSKTPPGGGKPVQKDRFPGQAPRARRRGFFWSSLSFDGEAATASDMESRGKEKGNGVGRRPGDGRVPASLAAFCLILGGMALDPVMRLFLFAVSAALSLAAFIRSTGGLRAVAALILLLSALPAAKEHFEAYRGRRP